MSQFNSQVALFVKRPNHN